jgi:hypothetical protein
MKKAIEHKVQAQVKSEAPEILFEVIYQDDFTNDHYVLKSLNENTHNSNSIKFNVSKNGKELTSIEMKERNVENFLNEFMDATKDADFNDEFKSKIYNISERQIKDFFEFFDKSIVLKGLTLEGEINRMKRMAGIIKS